MRRLTQWSLALYVVRVIVLSGVGVMNAVKVDPRNTMDYV